LRSAPKRSNLAFVAIVGSKRLRGAARVDPKPARVIMSKPSDLLSTFVVIQPNQAAIPVEVTPAIFEELDARFEQFRGRWLVSSFAFDANWSTWEMHPAGDEIVCLLSGEASLVLERDGIEDAIHLRDPGSFVIVPKGTWHTARTSVPTKMLFVTPGEGTGNRPIL
jgi:mannose-6-phosphate isomerase-like protein (cupin superfamily)